ncbi:MAG: hypothetical protein GX113_08155 [Actinobacteria bacterium]|jgi:hypothetical protein|nr:hypothetical protein [Actinomycetota bacterium]
MTALGTPLPFVWTPHPVVAMSREALYGYIEGDDPLTGDRVIDEIIAALTEAPGDGGSQTGPLPLPQEEAVVREEQLAPDTEDNLQRLFYERGWTDGLPVILPTEERVERMLGGTGRPRDEQVGEIFNHDTKELIRYTVRDIAVVAVMAGARPEHLPVILATAATKQSALTPSTTPFGSMLVVNGPIRNEIGMNSGLAAFSPINLANAVIGRAWTLMSICWGYARPKVTLWSSQGNGFLYNNMCVAENEEQSVWAPFHTQKGFKPEESVVSVWKGWNAMNSLQAAASRTVGEEIGLQLSVVPAINSSACIVMDPLVARQLKESDGFESKEDFSRWISENALIPNGRYWDTDTVDMLMTPLASAGVEPYISWKKLPDDELIPHYHNADNINIVVAGGETSPVWKTTDYACWGVAPVDHWRP